MKTQNNSSKYIIPKENGRIILAYKAFEDFLNSDKSWESYKKIVLEAYPEMQAVHRNQLNWGTIDSLKFPEELKNYKKEDWEKYFNQYDEKTLNFLYDSIIVKADQILKSMNNNPIDLCLFLPYSGCFMLPGQRLGDYFRGAYIQCAITYFRDLNDYKSLTIDDTLMFEPGTRFSYSNTGMLISGAVIENITHEKYFDYLFYPKWTSIFHPKVGSSFICAENVRNLCTRFYFYDREFFV